MVNRRDALKIAAGAALGTQVGGVSASTAQDRDTATGSFVAGLTGGQQSPPVETEARGGATFAVHQDAGAVSYAVTVEGIENPNQAHIHRGAPGENGPVVAWLYPGPEAQEPRLVADRFDGVLARGVVGADDLTGPLEGESLDALVEAMADGEAYVNVHTEENPGGEIRGQIVSVEEMVGALGFEEEADAATPEEEDETAAPEEETPTPAEETPTSDEETPDEETPEETIIEETVEETTTPE